MPGCCFCTVIVNAPEVAMYAVVINSFMFFAEYCGVTEYQWKVGGVWNTSQWVELTERIIRATNTQQNNSTLRKMEKQEMTHLRKQLREMTRQLQQKEQELERNSETIRHKDTTIQRKEQELERNAETIRHKDTTIQRNEQLLQQNEATIQRKERS